jgi:AraC-like DNA-binding protein
MIWGAKSMIAGCIERMRQSSCGGCERRDACASLFKALGFDSRPERSTARPRERTSAPAKNPFMALLGAVAKAMEGRMAARKSAFRSDVESRMEAMLALGPVRIDQVARALGCGRQTLYRRLKAEGVTFAEILDELRRRLALRFVREQGLSVKESAYRLGFSDPAAFSRAFKRWTGKSPSEARGRDRN